MQKEKELLEENFKVKEELIVQYKASLEQESKNAQSESNMKQDLEMQLSKAKVELAVSQEDTESLVDCVVEVGEKYAKKGMNMKDTYGRIRGDKLKSMLVERLSQSGIKYSI